MSNARVCKKCSASSAEVEFMKSSANPDGLGVWCLACSRLWQKEYRAKNTERIRARSKAWREMNSLQTAAHRKAWRDKNVEARKQYNQVWGQSNKELVVLAASRRRARKVKAGVFLITDRDLTRLRKSTCFYCHASPVTEIDHIIPVSRGGRHSIGNLVGACFSCNRSKGSQLIMEWEIKKRFQSQEKSTV